MAKIALDSGNVFSYMFGGSGIAASNSGILIGSNNPIFNSIVSGTGVSATIECWIKPTTVGGATNQTIFSKRAPGGTAIEYSGYVTSGNGFIGATQGNPTTTDFSYQAGNTTRVIANTWNHVAWVYTSTRLDIYVNGSRCASNTTATYPSALLAPLSIGCSYGTAGNPQFIGEISNFRIIKDQTLYNGDFLVSTNPVQLPTNSIGLHIINPGSNTASSLSGNTILLTCASDKLTYYSNVGTINNFTVTGDVYPHIVDPKDLNPFSYYFPGNTNSQNASVLITNATNGLNLNTTNFAISFWYYPTSNTGVILERGYGGERNNLASYIFLWDTPNNVICFASANANNATGYAVGGLTNPSGNVGKAKLNDWHYIIAYKDSTSSQYGVTMFNSNGVQQNGSANFGALTANIPYDAIGRGITIGGMFNNGQTYGTAMPSNTINGYISSVRILRGTTGFTTAYNTPLNGLVNFPPLPNITNTVLLTASSPLLEDLTSNHTISVIGAQNQIYPVQIKPSGVLTTNTVPGRYSLISANAANVNAIRTYSTGTRSFKVYTKINDAIKLSISPRIPNAYATRNYKIYNRFDQKTNSSEFGVIANAYGTRNFKVYNRFDQNKGSSEMGIIPNAFGTRNFKVYDRFNLKNKYGYFTFPSTANISYQYWS